MESNIGPVLDIPGRCLELEHDNTGKSFVSLVDEIDCVIDSYFVLSRLDDPVFLVSAVGNFNGSHLLTFSAGCLESSPNWCTKEVLLELTHPCCNFFGDLCSLGSDLLVLGPNLILLLFVHGFLDLLCLRKVSSRNTKRDIEVWIPLRFRQDIIFVKLIEHLFATVLHDVFRTVTLE